MSPGSLRGKSWRRWTAARRGVPVGLGTGNTLTVLAPRRVRTDVGDGAQAQGQSTAQQVESLQAARKRSAGCTRSCRRCEVITEHPIQTAGAQFNNGKLGVHSPILKWWKEHAVLFPYLSQVARRYLAMPATSDSVERLFSVSGQVVTVKRNRLTPHTACVFT